METLKVSVSELTGAALDWAVAMAVDVPVELYYGPKVTWIRLKDYREGDKYEPSTNWSQCGPLIANGFRWLHNHGGWWSASAEGVGIGEADDALVAICRAIVVANLGPEVEVPQELMP